MAWVMDPDALVPQAQRAHGARLATTLDTDWTWGARTARQRLVLRLGLYAEAAESVPAHAGPRQLALKLQQALARHWDITTDPQPCPVGRWRIQAVVATTGDSGSTVGVASLVWG